MHSERMAEIAVELDQLNASLAEASARQDEAHAHLVKDGIDAPTLLAAIAKTKAAREAVGSIIERQRALIAEFGRLIK